MATHLLYLALGTVNSTVNFFVYFSRSSRFRVELFKILPRCSQLWGAARRECSDVNETSGVTSLPTRAASISSDARSGSSHFVV